MRAARVVSYALVIQALWMFIGCCGDTIFVTFEWNHLSVAHLENSGSWPVEVSGENPIRARAYGIRMKIDSQMIASSGISPLPTAHATSCVDTYVYTNRDTVLNLRIHALEAPSGSLSREVTEDFMALEPRSSSIQGTVMTVADFVRRMNENRSPSLLASFIRTKNQQPATAVRFIITLELSNGKTLADTTSPITLSEG